MLGVLVSCSGLIQSRSQRKGFEDEAVSQQHGERGCHRRRRLVATRRWRWRASTAGDEEEDRGGAGWLEEEETATEKADGELGTIRAGQVLRLSQHALSRGI